MISVRFIALGEHSRLADDVTADPMHDLPTRSAIHRADDVVYDENTLTLQHVRSLLRRGTASGCGRS